MATKKLQILGSLTQGSQNADTLDGKHADEFASAVDVETLKSRVGDTSVSEQIAAAVYAITNAEIDDICGQVIYSDDEVEL